MLKTMPNLRFILTLCLPAVLFLGGILSPLCAQDFETKLIASDGAESDRFGHAVSINSNRAIIGAYLDDDNGGDSGSAYVLKWNGTAWVEEAKLLASDGAVGDWFGFSVSIDNDRAIIGAYWDDDNGTASGSAYIFKWNGAAWVEEAKLLASDGARDDYFGYAVSIDSNRVIIGAHQNDENGDNSGSTYIFKWNGTAWVEEAKLMASDGVAWDLFGSSVSIDNDRALIGAFYDDDNGGNSGSAYIFKRNDTTWVEEAKLIASDGAFNDFFGKSVSIDNDLAIIGAYYDYLAATFSGHSSGSAYIFRWNGTTWVEEAKLSASDGADHDGFGRSVSIANDRAITGAYWENDNDGNSGSAYIFKWNGTAWVEEAKIVASDGAAYDLFGRSVSIANDRAIIGAGWDDDNGTYSGSAYIYEIQLPFPDYTTTSLAFNSVPFGEQVQRTFSVQNVGVVDLIVSDMSFNINGYSVIPDTFTLSHSQSQIVTVTFAPDLPGTYEGELVITYNSLGSPDMISISGSGVLSGAVIDSLAVFAVLPSYVNVMFLVTELNGSGLTILNDVTYFDIWENGNPISETEAIPIIGKMDEVPFNLKTILMLDNSFSIGLALDSLKTAALALVNSMVPEQAIAVFAFSEDVTLLQDFTQDVGALAVAINSITLGPPSTNLYGAVITGANHRPDVFSSEKIEQVYLIVLTDGRDTQGSSTLAEALAARGSKQVITIGVGGNADVNILQQIQTVGYFAAADFSVLPQVFENIQERIIGLANSFYWLVYVSPTRGANTHTLEIGLKDNLFTGEGSTVSVTFSSEGFSSVVPGVYVDRSFEKLNGIDSVAFEEDSASSLLTAETLFGLLTPLYEWASGDTNIITVKPVEGDPTQAIATQEGQFGQSTTITVSDTANGYSKELYATVSLPNLAVEYNPGLPGEFSLHQNYPNPFNPSTTIRFDLPAATEVHLAVYDLLGREVVRLVDGQLQAGYHKRVWNGRDRDGREVPTGIYFVLVVTPEFRKSIKVVLLK